MKNSKTTFFFFEIIGAEIILTASSGSTSEHSPLLFCGILL